MAQEVENSIICFVHKIMKNIQITFVLCASIIYEI